VDRKDFLRILEDFHGETNLDEVVTPRMREWWFENALRCIRQVCTVYAQFMPEFCECLTSQEALNKAWTDGEVWRNGSLWVVEVNHSLITNRPNVGWWHPYDTGESFFKSVKRVHNVNVKRLLEHHMSIETL
jgi:hypothetical protein